MSRTNTPIEVEQGKKGWLSLPARYSNVGLFIGDHSVVEYWERPIQEVLAESICQSSSARILEIGYGLGLSAKAIAAFKPETHIIVEAHPDVVSRAVKEMPSSTNIISGLWEQIVPTLNSNYFDGIIYDAYPMTEAPFDGSPQSTFRHVMPFLNEGARILSRGGLLGFLDFSCGVTLLEAFNPIVKDLFSEVYVQQLKVKIPSSCSFAHGDRSSIILLKR